MTKWKLFQIGLIILHTNGVCMYMHNYMHTKSKKEFPINFAKKLKKRQMSLIKLKTRNQPNQNLHMHWSIHGWMTCRHNQIKKCSSQIVLIIKKPDCYMYDTYIQTSIQVFGIRNLNFTFQSPISNLLYTFIQTKFITQPQILIE